MSKLISLLIIIAALFNFSSAKVLAQEEEDPCEQYASRYTYDYCHISKNGDGNCEDSEDIVETICCCGPSKSE